MSHALTGAAILSLAIWAYLLISRGGFWRADQRLPDDLPAPPSWPAVVAVVPARDEAAVIERSLASLLDQDYPGALAIVLVDDHSTDGTGAIAAGLACGTAGRLAVIQAPPLPPGWSGKLWALAAGLDHPAARDPAVHHVLLTDADIAHDPGSVRRLVAKAEAERLDLVSLMVRLDAAGFWARLLIPAFVFFFQKLYPFPWVNDPGRSEAAAAGGCVLVRRSALEAAGGIAAIRGELIDDCALARTIKRRPGSGGIWLGLTGRVRSLRPYAALADIWSMVARTAFTQLRHSALLLAGTLAAMILTYLVPPAAALSWPLHGDWVAALAGLGAWLAMAVAVQPSLRLYGRPGAEALLLPVAGLLYSLMTVASALRHWRGRGGQWKGRVHHRSA